MKKKSVYIMICIICVSIGIGWYLSPMPLDYLVSNEIQMEEVEEISINVLTSHLQNIYKVNDKVNIDKITNILEDIKVRRVISPPVTFRPPLGKTYCFILTSKNKAVLFSIMDKDYLTVMTRVYKIVNQPNLKDINDIIDSL